MTVSFSSAFSLGSAVFPTGVSEQALENYIRADIAAAVSRIVDKLPAFQGGVEVEVGLDLTKLGDSDQLARGVPEFFNWVVSDGKHKQTINAPATLVQTLSGVDPNGDGADIHINLNPPLSVNSMVIVLGRILRSIRRLRILMSFYMASDSLRKIVFLLEIMR